MALAGIKTTMGMCTTPSLVVEMGQGLPLVRCKHRLVFAAHMYALITA